MNLPKTKTRKGRLCPWTIARLFAETTLSAYPDDLKRVVGYVRARDIKSLANVTPSVAPTEYQSAYCRKWLALRQLSALFKKNEAFTTPDADQVARDRFLAAESLCRRTNRRIDFYERYPDRLDPELRLAVAAVKREISELLGAFDEDVFNDMLRCIKLTSGGTEDRTRQRSFPFLKFTGKLRCASRAVPFVRHYVNRVVGVSIDDVVINRVDKNAVIFVPKNWKTSRTIAKEPTHSMPFQLALDALLKKRLKRWGVDLSSQKRNQDYACLGSKTGAYSTIDLEMASDTLSMNTVASLLPCDWFAMISAFRSQRYTSAFGEGVYAKFSSMGNGVTFSLETLIFAAICRASGVSKTIVYGDDLVVDSCCAPNVVRLLKYFGFRVNEEKSCISDKPGFRESCGHDYIEGVLVTPFYMRESPDLGQSASVSHVINGLVRVCGPGPLWDWLAALTRDLRLRLVPENSDTMSGVFIPTHMAWSSRLLYTCKRNSAGVGPWVPIFKGYSSRQTTRRTSGWRSYLLWHVNAQRRDSFADTAPSTSMRISRRILNARDASDVDDTSTSVVSTRVRYVNAQCIYVPVQSTAPFALALWGELVWEVCSLRRPVVNHRQPTSRKRAVPM